MATATKEYTKSSTENTDTIKWTGTSNENLSERISKLNIPNLDVENVCEVIEFYYSKYKETLKRNHPNLNDKCLVDVISGFKKYEKLGLNITVNTYAEIISQHFKTIYTNCDYNICHFVSGTIIDHRFYETERGK